MCSLLQKMCRRLQKMCRLLQKICRQCRKSVAVQRICSQRDKTAEQLGASLTILMILYSFISFLFVHQFSVPVMKNGDVFVFKPIQSVSKLCRTDVGTVTSHSRVIEVKSITSCTLVGGVKNVLKTPKVSPRVHRVSKHQI